MENQIEITESEPQWVNELKRINEEINYYYTTTQLPTDINGNVNENEYEPNEKIEKQKLQSKIIQGLKSLSGPEYTTEVKRIYKICLSNNFLDFADQIAQLLPEKSDLLN